MKTKYWLENVLLNMQSDNPVKQDEAWGKLVEVTGRNYSSFESVTDAIVSAYKERCSVAEKILFLKEVKRLIRDSKKLGFTLDTMSMIMSFATMAGEINAIAGTLAKTFLSDWKGKEERHILTYDLLSSLSSFTGPNPVFYRVILLLHNKGWTPVSYSIYVCQALLEMNPEKWFVTLARMTPVMNRLRNRVMRSCDKAERNLWSFAEGQLLTQLKAIQATCPQ